MHLPQEVQDILIYAQAIPRVTSQGCVCGAVYRVASEHNFNPGVSFFKACMPLHAPFAHNMHNPIRTFLKVENALSRGPPASERHVIAAALSSASFVGQLLR